MKESEEVVQTNKNIKSAKKKKPSFKNGGKGYIIIAKRKTEDGEIFFVIEKSTRNPNVRVKEWGDRILVACFETECCDFAEKTLHKVFEKFRCKRESASIPNKNEVEWFNIPTKNLFETSNLGFIKKTIKELLVIWDKKCNFNKKVNINTASMDELETLPGIAKGLSKRIIEYRTKNGPFKKIEDLIKVPYIKEGKFGSIESKICV